MDAAPAPAVPAAAPEHARPEPYGLEHRSRFYFLLLPLLISFGLLFLSYVVGGWGLAIEILTVVGISFTIVGPTVILGRAVLGPDVLPDLSLDTTEIAALIAYTSLLLAFVYSFNLDLFERIPRVGDWFRRVRLGAQRTLRSHKWIRRLAVAGVGIFVLLPLPGSGSLGGAVVGRLIGLGPLRTFLATGIAGVLVAVGYGYGGRALENVLDARSVPASVRVAGVLVLLLLLWLLLRFFAAMARRTRAEEARPDPGDSRMTAA